MKGHEVQTWAKVGLGLTGSAAGGALLGGYAQGRHEHQMAEQIRHDLWVLGAEDRLPPAQPLFSLQPRRVQRSMAACYLWGILGAGFIGWLITLIITSVVVSAAGGEETAARSVVLALGVAFLGGLVAFVPGILVGGAIWLREVRSRIREDTAVPYREFWTARQQGANALASGQATSYQVAQVLAAHLPEAEPIEDERINPL